MSSLHKVQFQKSVCVFTCNVSVVHGGLHILPLCFGPNSFPVFITSLQQHKPCDPGNQYISFLFASFSSSIKFK